jgi:hypothetical protein
VRKLSVLAAYPYLKGDVLEVIARQGDKLRFLLDSGAFTAWKAGSAISLDAYCRFIETLPFEPWRYFTLDVIGDPVATMRNYETMLRRGFKPVPIFTRGEELSALDHFYRTTDLVGLGGVAGADKASYQWVRAVTDYLGPRKAHILGFTSMDWIKYLKPYSCDSSSWESAARYGVVQFYLGRGQFTKLEKGSVFTKPTKAVLDRVRRYGINPNTLTKADNWRGGDGVARRLSAGSWVDLSLDVEHHLGTHLFLAFATKQAGQHLFDQFDRLTALRRAA